MNETLAMLTQAAQDESNVIEARQEAAQKMREARKLENQRAADEQRRTPEGDLLERLKKDRDAKGLSRALNRDAKREVKREVKREAERLANTVVVRDDVPPPAPAVVERLIPANAPMNAGCPPPPSPQRRPVAPIIPLSSIPVSAEDGIRMDAMVDDSDEEIKNEREKEAKNAEERKRKWLAEQAEAKKKHDMEEKAKRTAANLRLAQIANEKARAEAQPLTPRRRSLMGFSVPSMPWS